MGASGPDIRRKLERAFAPAEVEVVDESELHRGHQGWREGGGTHFRVRIISEAFAGKSRLARHRLVHAALDRELANDIHALAITARTPGE